MHASKWIDWFQRLQAIAHNGLTYAENHYDIERYEKIRDLAIEMASANTGATPRKINDLFALENGYITPKIDVRGAVFKDHTILLVREKGDGLWSLPGGWADVGDAPSEAVEREIYEESGYKTHAVKLIAAYDRNRHEHDPYPFHAYKLFFLCELIGGEACASNETIDVGFFAENALPPLSTTRVTTKQIGRIFEHQRCPNLPTDFD
ncbi:MAG: NUDIX hydrolase [Anaerolineae bacterium]|nr:NUDIX hydrolase [Anaerolineae bacterium]